jgi:lysophospholipase L1-like esterase
MRGLLWWGVTLPLLPLLIPQAVWARRRTQRLPEAAGPQQGCSQPEWRAAPLHLLLIGESTVAGVGVASQRQALAGQLAEVLAQRLQRPVHWQARGANGIRIAQACERLVPVAPVAELVILTFGVNDCTALSSLAAWEAGITRLVRMLEAEGRQLVFTGVPPLAGFHALPWLLRQVLGWRGRLLDQRLAARCHRLGVGYVPLGLSLGSDALAEDGYHPSAAGYRAWAEQLGQALQANLPAAEGSTD